MNYGELRADVESAMGRSDIPAYVYRLTTAGVNRDCRFLDMEVSGTIDTSANPQDLPTNFHSMISIYILSAGDKCVLEAVRGQAANYDNNDRVPRFYSIEDGKIRFSPEPDGTYDVYMQYIKSLGSLTADGDTNSVMVRYPGLYLYQALMHAATWAKDSEARAAYGENYAVELSSARKDDERRRDGVALVSRSRRL